MVIHYNIQHPKEKKKVKQNAMNVYYCWKEKGMELLKKKHIYPYKIVNRLIMKNLNHI